MKRSRGIGLLVTFSVLLIVPVQVLPQAQQPLPTAVPGFYDALDKNAVAVRQGEATFYQRCSLCHLPRIRKAGTTPGPAPSLTGLLKGADKEEENRVRSYILKGSNLMPGWQYSLKPAEIDEVIAYLKTL
jgi:mono/diheme cytochrome c family protein